MTNEKAGKITKILLVAMFIAALGGTVWIYLKTNVISVEGNWIKKIRIDEEILRVEVVASDKKMQKGLGGRSSLCADCGMIFVFSAPGKHAFWMKGMEFPLDIIWLDNGEVIQVERNISLSDPKTFSPNSNADMVLELNAGMAEKYGLKEGSKLDIE